MQRLTTEQLTGLTDTHIEWLSPRIGLQPKVKQAWLKMKNAALSDGIMLEIASGFRGFDRQLAIWNNKYNGLTPVKNLANHQVDIEQLNDLDKLKVILLYSALPGASRHHWGTDLDIYASNLLPSEQELQLESWEYEKGGPFHQLTIWLNDNSANYGFYFPYNKYRGGVAAEPWHLSYKPLAEDYLQLLSIDTIISVLGSQDIAGFDTIKEHIEFIDEQFIKNIG